MNVECEHISEDDFHDAFGVHTAASGDLLQYADVADQPINHVWTVVESGNDENQSWYAMPGFHFVNRLGYVLTREPWVNASQDAIYFHVNSGPNEKEVLPDTKG